MFDPSPARMLARKYEAATERAMYKALKEFHQAEAQARANPAPSPSQESSPVESKPEESGSSFQETEENAAEVETGVTNPLPAAPRLRLAADQPLSPGVEDGPDDLERRRR